jgi:hypothetical protein
MRIVSILLALVNSLLAGLVMLSCLTASNMSLDSLSWTIIRVLSGIFVIFIGLLTFLDCIQPVSPRKVLFSGLLLVVLGSASVVWGVHLSVISGDVKNAMLAYGGSLLVQGITSVWGLQDSPESAATT